MDANALTRSAEQAGQRYAVFLEAMRGAFARVSAATRLPGSDRTRSLLRRDAYALGRVYLEVEQGEIEDALRAAALAAQTDTIEEVGGPTSSELAEAVEEHVALLVDGLSQEMRLQVERDVSLMMGALRGMALRDALRASPGATTKRGRGEAAAAREEALEALTFQFTDRSNRRWPSPRHVRTLYRQALVLGWNETALLTAGELGLETLEITHPDASHGALGQLVAVAGETDGAISWEAAREEGIFHPQTHAWLRPVSQS